MRRTILTLPVLIALIVEALPGGVAAAVPEYQRVITSRHADAAFSMIDGCLLTEVFLGSGDAIYGGRPGPVNKQGLTDVSVGISDTCQPPVGKGYPLVAMWQGQTLDPLVSTPRLTVASIHAVVPVYDEVSGRTANAIVDVTWMAAGPLDHDTGHLHAFYRRYGMANSHWNTWLRAATAQATLVIDGAILHLGPSPDAHLELVRYGCQTIIHPLSGGDLDC
jgi:hypothetical protein